jgi:hypothetical protein
MRNIFLFLCLFCVAACIGCGSKGFSVSGTVTLSDGKPVARGQVMLTSGTFTAGGETIADGTYIIRDVPAGTYKVSVRASGESESNPNVDVEDAKPVKPVVDMKYNNPETSGLTCEVKSATTFDIVVEPPK